MIIIAGTVRIDPADREPAIAAATDMMAASNDEDGCVSYVFSADFHDPGLFHLFEEWETAEALAAHATSAHMGVWREKLGTLRVLGRDIQKYEASGKAPLG